MRNILLTISYDGTDFCGWQRQDDADGGEANRTVQGEVEKALEKVHKQKTTLYGSGRTDSGVHAIGQAANFYSPFDSIPAENYVRALNAFLPEDVRIVDGYPVESLELQLKWMIEQNRPKDQEKIKIIKNYLGNIYE